MKKLLRHSFIIALLVMLSAPVVSSAQGTTQLPDADARSNQEVETRVLNEYRNSTTEGRIQTGLVVGKTVAEMDRLAGVTTILGGQGNSGVPSETEPVWVFQYVEAGNTAVVTSNPKTKADCDPLRGAYAQDANISVQTSCYADSSLVGGSAGSPMSAFDGVVTRNGSPMSAFDGVVTRNSDGSPIGTPTNGSGGTNSFAPKSIWANPLQLKDANGQPIDTLPAFLLALVDLIFLVGMPIITLFIIYAGFLFVKAQGDMSAVTKAREVITWTIIGAGVLLGSKAIALAIQGTILALK